MSQKGIKVLMAEKRIFPPSKEFSERAHIKSLEEYEKLYKRSVEDPEASGLKWQKKTSPGLKNGIRSQNDWTLKGHTLIVK
jgi:hypothetical protein